MVYKDRERAAINQKDGSLFSRTCKTRSYSLKCINRKNKMAPVHKVWSGSLGGQVVILTGVGMFRIPASIE